MTPVSTRPDTISITVPGRRAPHRRGQRPRLAERLGAIPAHALLTIYAIVVAYPLLWMVISSFKASRDITQDPWGLPATWLVGNYAQAWKQGISAYFVNSLVVTLVSTVATVLLAALCAYGMTMVNEKVATLALLVTMGGLVVAPQVALIPLYRFLDALGLLNTIWAMILPYIAFRLPMAILLIRSVFLGIPRELVDAATVDGANTFSIFRNVYLPLSRSVLVTAGVLTAYYAWNEFLFAIVFVDSQKLRTIPAGLMAFRDALSTDWGVLLAGLVIAALPIVIAFLFLQRYFVAGVTAGSVKG